MLSPLCLRERAEHERTECDRAPRIHPRIRRHRVHGVWVGAGRGPLCDDGTVFDEPLDKEVTALFDARLSGWPGVKRISSTKSV